MLLVEQVELDKQAVVVVQVVLVAQVQHLLLVELAVLDRLVELAVMEQQAVLVELDKLEQQVIQVVQAELVLVVLVA